MTDRHLEEGIIQAYIDGELSQEQAAAAAAHLAACEACSAALASAEDETSFFAAAFAPDEALSVPTAALRARLNESVARLEAAESKRQGSQGWSFGGFLATLSGAFTFTPRAAAGFAALLVAVAVGIIYLSSQRPRQTNDATQVAQTDGRAPAPAVRTTPEVKDVPPSVAAPSKGEKAPAYVAAGYTRKTVRKLPVTPRTPQAVREEAVPGEKEYRTAIASLEKTIKFGGEQSLRPAVRADYERNLALLDSAIQQTRQVAAQNPKDKDAVGFLMAAYQSKVELLTRVADQAQVAALGR